MSRRATGGNKKIPQLVHKSHNFDKIVILRDKILKMRLIIWTDSGRNTQKQA